MLNFGNKSFAAMQTSYSSLFISNIKGSGKRREFFISMAITDIILLSMFIFVYKKRCYFNYNTIKMIVLLEIHYKT